MALNFEVVAKSPATAKAIGIPVSSEGALPKEVTLSRATLETLGFTGKVGQTYVVPAEKGAVSILIGVGVASVVFHFLVDNVSALRLHEQLLLTQECWCLMMRQVRLTQVKRVKFAMR